MSVAALLLLAPTLPSLAAEPRLIRRAHTLRFLSPVRRPGSEQARTRHFEQRQDARHGEPCPCSGDMRRRMLMQGLVVASLGAGLSSPAHADPLWGPKAFACCMATRMGSYETSVQQEKQRHFEDFYRAAARGDADTSRPLRILEVGVGPGPNMPLHAKASGGRVELTGVDVNEDMRPFATTNAKSADVAFQFVTGNAQGLPFDEGTFDGVVVTHVLCSVPNPQEALQEIARVIKPGGAFMFWEHVGSWDQPGLRMQQDLFNPLQQMFFQGCNLNRDSMREVQMCDGFDRVEGRRVYLGDRALLSPHALGIAYKA